MTSEGTSMSMSDGKATAATPRARSLHAWPVIALAAAVAAFAVHAVVYAPSMWRAAERLKAEQIAQEDRMFCEKFRMPPDSDSFAACAGYLREIRRLHGERIAAESAGIL
jgi:hypothetical protein